MTSFWASTQDYGQHSDVIWLVVGKSEYTRPVYLTALIYGGVLLAVAAALNLLLSVRPWQRLSR